MAAAESLYVFEEDGSLEKANDVLGLWRDRRTQAQQHRQQFEDVWRLCNEFLANKQWVGLNRQTRELVDLREREEELGREHYTINVLAQYFRAAVGRVYVGDFCPDFAFRREDWTAQAVTRQANRAFRYCWDEELGADEVIFEVLSIMCGLGTAGMRCRFDKTLGRELGEVPTRDGEPILNQEEARAHVADMQMRGEQVSFQTANEGKILWEELLPTNILPPPGVRRERDFPWLIIDRPVAVSAVKTQYGGKAEGLGEENLKNDSGKKLKGHVSVSTGYERPTRKYPKGRMIVWAGDKILESRSALPYMVKGEPKMGVTFFHWQRLLDRFWSTGVNEPMIGPQRNMNRARSQNIESKDRMGLGRVYARPGSVTKKNLSGSRIGELLEVKQQFEYPQESAGTGPGPWIQAEAEISKADMKEVSGMQDVSFGQAPQGVSAYSAMALLKEEIDRNLGPVMIGVRGSIAEASEVTLEAMRLYWLPNKELLLAGDEHIVDAVTFNAADLPLAYYIEKQKGAPAPEGRAAGIQKCFDIFDRAAGRLPLSWLVDSLEAGKPLPLPREEMSAHEGKAEQENAALLEGRQIQPAEYDNDQMHIQVHRALMAQLQLLPGYELAVQTIQQHVQAHSMAAQLKQGAAMMGQGMPQAQGPAGQLSQAPPGSPLTPPTG